MKDKKERIHLTASFLSCRLVALTVYLLSCSSCFVFSDDVDHFRASTVPPDEARILALTGVREFRCDYEVMPSPSITQNIQGSQFNYQEDLQLFAELYEGTTCVGRYRLAVSVNAFNDLTLPLKGIFSFGWNNEKHELVSVIDNKQFYSPWTASLILKDFSYVDHFFFENSAPEKRQSEYEANDFNIYPVVGICGDRNLKISYWGITDVPSFLKVCKQSHAQKAIVIYLYKGLGGGDVPLKFDEPTSFDSGLYFYRSWLANRLAVAASIALVIFLLYWFISCPKRETKRER